MKKFNDPDDIPLIPVFKTEEERQKVFNELIECGAIPKSELVVGKTYIGSCRNSTEATWNGTEFLYTRYKWGFKYQDSINHFEDDDGYDVFIPIKEL